MPAYTKATINQLLSIVDNPLNAAAKGKAFEDLACYLFENIPGIDITARNEMNSFLTEEIDVACKNDQDPQGLGGGIDFFFLIECKGWTNPVSSVEVAWFLTKIRHRGLSFGILIAANGITGESEDLSRSHFLLAAELAMHKIKMIVITRVEIEVLTSGEDLASLILKKICKLYASGGRCI